MGHPDAPTAPAFAPFDCVHDDRAQITTEVNRLSRNGVDDGAQGFCFPAQDIVFGQGPFEGALLVGSQVFVE